MEIPVCENNGEGVEVAAGVYWILTVFDKEAELLFSGKEYVFSLCLVLCLVCGSYVGATQTFPRMYRIRTVPKICDASLFILTGAVSLFLADDDVWRMTP